MRRLLVLSVLTVLLASCAPSAPGATPRSLPTVTEAPAATVALALATQTVIAPTGTATATSTPTLTVIQTCGESESACILDGHFLFQRPIGLGGKQSIEQSYPYGNTQGGTREPHHGVEFYNAQGTPVLAAADGKVIFAGNDKLTLLSWVTGYYGNVVVIEHHFPGFSQTFYTLYAHQYKINVAVGQMVKAGEQIGQVGATGTAIGSHLHFELRVTYDDYKSSRNPELWLAPLPETGVLAGRIVDRQGAPIKGAVNIQRIVGGVLDATSVASAETYANESQPVNGDDTWHENFAVGGLSAGDYRLTLLYNGTVYEQVIKIEPGKLTLVTFILK